MRIASAGLLAALALSVLVACGDDEPSEDGDSTPTTTTEESSPTSSGPSSSPPSGSPGGAGPGQVPRPAEGSCQPVAEAPDGVYVVADAGEVILRRDGGVLSVEVTSSGGWSVSSNTSGDEAEIEFSRNGEEIDFEAEIEDGRLVLQVCADDD